jgi:hypothetical protein
VDERPRIPIGADDAPDVVLSICCVGVEVGLTIDSRFVVRRPDGGEVTAPDFVIDILCEALCAAEVVMNDRTMVEAASRLVGASDG